MTEQMQVKIKTGDRISFRIGRDTFSGIVSTAVNYPNHNNPQDEMQDDWYVELQERFEGYMYIKQQLDHVTELKVLE